MFSRMWWCRSSRNIMRSRKDNRIWAGWRLGVFAAALCFGPALRGAEPPDVLKNVRLASRLGTDRVLIQGEMGQSELGYSGLQTVPGEAGLYRTGLLRVTPSYMATFRTEHPTNW